MLRKKGGKELLKKDSAIPLYSQLINILVAYIKDTLSVDDKMLSEREICEKYDVSRTTVRVALNELEEMGFIYKRHGKGTYVSGLWKEMKNLTDSYSFTEQMLQLGKIPKTKILSLNIKHANPYVAKNLGISEGEQVYKLKRLRCADGMEMMLETTFIPKYLFKGLTEEKLKNKSLYELYRSLYGQEIKYADEEFFASVAQEKEAERLSIPIGTACLRVFRTTYNQDNKIIEYTISVARGDQFVYKIRHSNQGRTPENK